MSFSLSSFYDFVSQVPYRIHPSLHFYVYKFLICFGFKNIFQDCVVKFMVKHIKKDDCVLDVGASMGTYTYSLLKAVGKQGMVYSFEPNPVTALQLSKNLKESNVKIENVAVSSTNGDKIFYMHTKVCGPTSSLEYFDMLNEIGELKETKVKCVTLDSFCRLHNLSPNLIKIDVEGHEFNVIKGAEATIRRHKPFIVFEFIEQFWEEKNIKSIFNFLSPCYHLIRIEDGVDATETYKDYRAQNNPDFRKSRVVNIGCIPRDEVDNTFGNI